MARQLAAKGRTFKVRVLDYSLSMQNDVPVVVTSLQKLLRVDCRIPRVIAGINNTLDNCLGRDTRIDHGFDGECFYLNRGAPPIDSYSFQVRYWLRFHDRSIKRNSPFVLTNT